MNQPTGPTFTTLAPQTLSDLIVVGIENSDWIEEIRKIKGLNTIDPFYACRDFWRSPFEIEAWANGKHVTVDFDDLCSALLTVAEKHPDILATFEKGNFSARQADRFVRLLLLGEAPRA
jgi:hypothetical protein